MPAAPLDEMYRALLVAWGPQHWWPAQTRFEVITGAILTQNTSWQNVSKALECLRAAGALTPAAMHRLSQAELGDLIRSSGYWRAKSASLKQFVDVLFQHHQGDLKRMLRQPLKQLREELLGIRGIGPETADCILLYAAGYPVFVIDAYTRRMLARHALPPGRDAMQLNYEQLRSWMEAQLPRSAALFNEFHALLVELGKRYCWKQNPACPSCPLSGWLPPEGGPPAAI